jgi:nucleotide-binding universal stress UspA family protein
MMDLKDFHYEHILLGLDHSDKSLKAFHEAVSMAKRNDAELVLVTVLEEPENLAYAADFYHAANIKEDVVEKMMEKVSEKVNAELNDLKKQAEAAGVKHVKVSAFRGIAKYAIVDYSRATKQPIDLIMVGDKGRGALERILLGSTTHYIVNHADCNVLVVK